MANRICILMYHEIYGPEDRELLNNLTNPAYNTEVNVFKRQMAWLHANDYRTLTINELLQQSINAREKSICLTFDDGWLGNYLHAYPILKAHGFRATFFIATDLIGKPRYMTWDHLVELNGGRMSIQSHTMSHRPLASLKDSGIEIELSGSKRTIEEKVGTVVNCLSLPHGSKTADILIYAKQVGYETICTSDVGIYTSDSIKSGLKRIAIGDSISQKEFESIVRGESRTILRIRIAKSVKNMVRVLIGQNNYRKFYRWAYHIRN